LKGADGGMTGGELTRVEEVELGGEQVPKGVREGLKTLSLCGQNQRLKREKAAKRLNGDSSLGAGSTQSHPRVVFIGECCQTKGGGDGVLIFGGIPPRLNVTIEKMWDEERNLTATRKIQKRKSARKKKKRRGTFHS